MGDKRRLTRTIPSLFLHAVFVVVALLPLYATVIIALTPDSQLLTPQLVPHFVCFENVVNAFRFIAKHVLNSLLYAVATTAIVVVVSVPAAYVLAAYRFKAKKLVLFVILITQMMAGIVVLPSLYYSLSGMNLINSRTVLIVVLSAVNLALSVWLLYGYFRTLPTELEDAARIDGAKYLPFLLRIIVPISGPGIAVSSIFVFVNSYNEFVIPLFLLSSNKRYPLTLSLYSLLTDVTIRWNVLASSSLIAIIPPIVLFFVFQKYVISGLTAGSVKS